MRELLQSEICLRQEPSMIRLSIVNVTKHLLALHNFPHLLFGHNHYVNKRPVYALYSTAVAPMSPVKFLEMKVQGGLHCSRSLTNIKPSTFPALLILALWLSHSSSVLFGTSPCVTTRTKPALVERSQGKMWWCVLQLSSCHLLTFVNQPKCELYFCYSASLVRLQTTALTLWFCQTAVKWK